MPILHSAYLDSLVKNSINEEKLQQVTRATVEACLAPITAQLGQHTASLKTLQEQFEQLKVEQVATDGR